MGPSRPAAFPLLILLALSGCVAQLTNNGATGGKECPDVCGSCSEDGTCEYCGPGTMQVGNASSTGAVTCVKCQDPLCVECGPAPDKCQYCYSVWPFDGAVEPVYPVYMTSNKRCQKCVNHPLASGCQSCNAVGRCESCATGYVLSNGACKKCKGGEYCLECNPVTLQCTTCASTSGLDSLGQCRDCATGLDPYGEPLCWDCNANYRICTVCTPGFYVTQQQKCLQLPDNCLDANPKGQCTACFDGYFLTAANKCVPCGDGCERCASATTCAKCTDGYALSPQKKCLACSRGCNVCKLAANGQPRCARCYELSLVNGECRRCDDPRCADCSGNVHWCKACRYEAHVVNKATGRCEDPTWPVPCPGGGPGRRGGCTSPVRPPNPRPTGRRLQGPVVKPAIINGRDAPKGRYPYMASQRVDSEDGPDQLNCGASLVHERVVMLAAHCVLDGLDWSWEDGVFSRIRIGGYEQEGGQYEVRRAKWAVVHPNVAMAGGHHLVYDIALLLLDRPSTMRPVLRLPPAVPRPAAAPGTMLTAIGWGVAEDASDGSYYLPRVLQEATLEMIPLRECAAYFAKAAPDEKWDSQFCAGRPEKHVDTCAGDSGSPLISKGPSGDVAVGITTWGNGCAGDTPGVYADLAAASNWIRNAIQWMLREDAAGRIRGPATNGSRFEGA